LLDQFPHTSAGEIGAMLGDPAIEAFTAFIRNQLDFSKIAIHTRRCLTPHRVSEQKLGTAAVHLQARQVFSSPEGAKPQC
jgi:hypothetical protein